MFNPIKRTVASVFLLLTMGVVTSVAAQGGPSADEGDYLNKRWKDVATRMPEAWYGSDEAKQVAENVLLAQKEVGGWAKNKPYHHPLSEGDKAALQEEKGEIGATFDNGATIQEMRFLAKVYAHLQDPRYKEAFEQGLDYIFASQYDNGGWPQFFPVRTGKSVAYSGHITYNDNAMVRILSLLQEIAAGDEAFAPLHLSGDQKAHAKKAMDKGVQCILNTQIVVDGKPTVWCAQHDENTLAPAKARAYELPSFSGSESADITLFLMSLKNPSERVVAAVEGAVDWFETHKVEGIKLEREQDADGKRNLIVVKDKKAAPLWGRFYDLETEQPFFCDRDGIKKPALADIGYERRNGYGWYTNNPADVLEHYPAWHKKVNAH
ncbi:pectinesterase [Catalinimonas alkaloidigena]|uniref:Pectinesterase n=2 Tax=Catalinimonas alkaloidigena TaxID=1075417 RepID=A0A1G9KMK6_9BACT|nr:pectinesterase [Catalinimonas alkaloidigena]